MLRVSDTADDENRKTCWPIPVAGPMRHDGEVLSAQFSADGQRVVTASRDKTARVWDAQMTCCSSLTWLKLLVDLFSKLWPDGDSETPAPDQVRATRRKSLQSLGDNLRD